MGVSVAAAVPSALSVLTALVPVDVAVLSSTVSAAAFVLVPSSAVFRQEDLSKKSIGN